MSTAFRALPSLHVPRLPPWPGADVAAPHVATARAFRGFAVQGTPLPNVWGSTPRKRQVGGRILRVIRVKEGHSQELYPLHLQPDSQQQKFYCTF